MMAIGLLVTYNTRHITANIQPDDHVQSSTLQGFYLGQLLIGALGAWGGDVAKFMPTVAGGSFVQTIRDPDTLRPWTGLAVLVAWAVVGTAVAAIELRRRDA